MARLGEFRQDLFYRLNVLSIRLPALRERSKDISLLASKFGERTAQAFAMPARPLTQRALEKLESHLWPGNVRELTNVIEQIYVRTEGSSIDARDVDEVLGLDDELTVRGGPPEARDLGTLLGRVERAKIADALARTRNKAEAARDLGMSRSNLYAKMKRHGIQSRDG